MIIKKCDKCSCYLRLLCTSKRNEVSIGIDEIVDVIGIPILKNYYSVDLLTVDSTIAIQALFYPWIGIMYWIGSYKVTQE